jgi:hypothetical protein
MCTVREHVVTDEGGAETQYAANLCDEAKCLEDFCGYSLTDHLPVQYWADWCPATRTVYFGGDWCDVAPWALEAMPTSDEVCAHVDTVHAAMDCQENKKAP